MVECILSQPDKDGGKERGDALPWDDLECTIRRRCRGAAAAASSSSGRSGAGHGSGRRPSLTRGRSRGGGTRN